MNRVRYNPQKAFIRCGTCSYEWNPRKSDWKKVACPICKKVTGAILIPSFRKIHRGIDPSEQAGKHSTVLEWAYLNKSKIPELSMLHAINLNEGPITDVHLFLPVAGGGWHGLYIVLSDNFTHETTFLRRMTDQGFLAVSCNSSVDAIKTVEMYLTKRKAIALGAAGERRAMGIRFEPRS